MNFESLNPIQHLSFETHISLVTFSFSMHSNFVFLLAQRARSAKGGADVVLAAAAFLDAVSLAELLAEGSVDEAGERDERKADHEVGEIGGGVEQTEAEATAAAVPPDQLGMRRKDAGSAAADSAASFASVDAAVAGA